MCQGGLAGHQHPTPDERADTTQDDTELVDAERCGRGCHALRVAQRIAPLKGVPRYLALSLPQVRYGLSVFLLEVYCTPGTDYICRQVSRQLMHNELARFYHHRTRKCMPPKKLRRDIQ